MNFQGKQDLAFQEKVREIHAEAMVKILDMNNAWVKNGHAVKELEGLVVELSTRLQTRGGTALVRLASRTCKIQLNYRLLSDNPGEIRSTYLHELAHVVANLSYSSGMGHSKAWKRVAVALGDTGERCHTMDVSAYKPKRKPLVRVAYSCSCHTYLITPRRAARAEAYLERTGRPLLSCRTCRKGLQYGPMAPLEAPSQAPQAPTPGKAHAA